MIPCFVFLWDLCVSKLSVCMCFWAFYLIFFLLFISVLLCLVCILCNFILSLLFLYAELYTSERDKKKVWMWVSEKVGKPLGGVGEVLYTEYIVLKNIFSIKKIEKGSWNWWSWPTWIIDRSGDWIDFQLCWMIRTDITRADLKRQEKMRKERRNEI